MIFDTSGTTFFSTSCAMIIANLYLVFTINSTLVSKFHWNMKLAFITTSIWQATSNLRYFVPFNEFGLDIMTTVHFVVGIANLLVIGYLSLMILEAFEVLTNINRVYLYRTKIVLSLLALLSIGARLLYIFEPRLDIGNDISLGILFLYGGLSMFIINGSSLYLLRLVYLDRLRVLKNNRHANNESTKKYALISALFLAMFVDQIFAFVTWTIGLLRNKESMIKSGELVLNIALFFYPRLIIGLRDLRFGVVTREPLPTSVNVGTTDCMESIKTERLIA
jgi:hypothetical protein